MKPTNSLQIQRRLFGEVPQFSKRDTAYVEAHPALRPFYKYEVNVESFKQLIQDKQKDTINRAVLVEVLQQQYEKMTPFDAVHNNITQLANENTFTIITAHQPSLFTGPLYYVYKIISTINLTQKLKATYPNYHFVPVFVTGGEDHDFEEVNHVHLFGKKLTWENEESGSVGMMKTASLVPVLEELKTILGDTPNAQRIFKIMEQTHTQFDRYSNATLEMANLLFGEEGLVVLNMNHAELKRLFIPFIKEEIFHQPSKKLVEETQEYLNNAGFKSQAYPREINFFYLKDQIRERIVQEDTTFQVLNTSISFSKEALALEIEKHPERFSPNVVMRPLYQETILPNLAYIGGGGELAYWMERQSQFAHFGVNFPMLIRRNSVLWLDKSVVKRMNKLQLSLDDLFQEEDVIIRQFVDRQAQNDLSIETQKNQLAEIFDTISKLAQSVDPTLKKAVLSEKTKQLKILQQLEGRLHRAEKQKHDTAIQQIRSLKAKLFPKNGLQERYDNFIPFYLKYGDDFINTLKQQLDPLEKGLVIISEA